MCGIAGGVGVQAPNRELLTKSLDSIDHRGPDERGTFLSDGISLGMCRLAIIDVASGQQPITDSNHQLQMVFNGEIYNFRELRKALESKGHSFTSHSDSEVVLHLYQEYGTQFVDHLHGMFAVAIWDSRDKSLVLARDHMERNRFSTHKSQMER
ncbi:MAG: hypothetical protein WDO06_01110 [Actinomycetota bacterium]